MATWAFIEYDDEHARSLSAPQINSGLVMTRLPKRGQARRGHADRRGRWTKRNERPPLVFEHVRKSISIS